MCSSDLVRESKAAISNARRQVASIIGADEKEIYFIACGTESDNWAIFGTADAKKGKSKHIITRPLKYAENNPLKESDQQQQDHRRKIDPVSRREKAANPIQNRVQNVGDGTEPALIPIPGIP